MSESHRQPDSDEDLLLRLREGERDAFEALVKRYERELFGYLCRYVGDDDLADDVFQNTFLQVFLKIQQYEPGRPARPWLYAIATNQAIDELRRKNRRSDQRTDAVALFDEDGKTRPLFELLASNETGPTEQIEKSEERERVRAAVARLPDLLRHVIILAYFQGLKYQDIAKVLAIPVGTVKSRLHAAVAKLSEEWDRAGREPKAQARSSNER